MKQASTRQKGQSQTFQDRIAKLEQQLAQEQEANRLLEMERTRLATVLEHLPIGVWITDATGRLISKNKHADQIWAGDAPLVDSVSQYQKYLAWYPEREHPLEPDEYPVAVTLKTGEAVGPVELRIIRFDNSEGAVLVSAVPIRDTQGALMGVAGINVDITHSKRAENALREAELKYRTLVEQIPKAVVYMDSLDPAIGSYYVSPQIEAMLGYTADEWQSNPRSWHERLHPEDRDQLLRMDAYHEASGEPFSLEYRLLARDGHTVWIRDEAVMIRDSKGKPLFSQGIMIDITHQKQVEQSLRESEEYFRFLADSMPQLVWTALPDGQVDYYNQRHQEYHNIIQVKGEVWEWAPVLHPDERDMTFAAWLNSLVTGEIYQVEHRVRMKDGTYRWHLSRGVPVRNEEGRITRWFGTATDIHDLKMAQEGLKDYAERLERSNKELEQFAFIASHDLQEPLRKIEMFGDLLLTNTESMDERARTYLERIRDAASRMRAMVSGLLQLSRVATQGKPFTQVDLRQITTEVLNDLETQLRRTGGRVELQSLPVIEGDPMQLHQLMQNLIGNALKYHKPGTTPEVKVSAEQAADRIQITIEDKGIGFEQEYAERIFQPFQRLVGRKEYEGSGMGLAICRRIVQRHAGTISVMSKPGEGTAFRITLPVHHPKQKSEHGKDVDHERSITTPGRRG